MSRFLDDHGFYQVRSPFVHYLDTNGNGTGTRNAVGNYSAAPTVFFYQPPPGITVEATKLMLHIGDKGQFVYDGYGALPGPLTNGVQITFYRLGQLALKLTDEAPLRKNSDVAHLNTDYLKNTYASNFETSLVSFDTLSFNTPLFMHGDLQDQIRFELNDSFVGLDDHHFILYGKK